MSSCARCSRFTRPETDLDPSPCIREDTPNAAPSPAREPPFDPRRRARIRTGPGPAARAIQLPDTMGANFTLTDTLTGRSGPEDYYRNLIRRKGRLERLK